MNHLVLVSTVIAVILYVYIAMNEDVIPYDWSVDKENFIYGITFLSSCTVIFGLTYTLMNQ